MLREMVGASETFTAFLAGKPFFSGMGSEMSLQLVGPGEGFVTEQPVAYERPKSSVPPQMSFEMGRLAVYFPATCNVTHVLFRFVRF